MTTNPPRRVRLHPSDERLLSWRFSDDWRGDCGISSNFSASARVLELGTRVQTSLAVREWGLEDDAAALAAVRLLRRVDTRLRRLTDHHHVRVLRGAYAPRGPYRPELLAGWKFRLDPTREIGGVLLVTPVAVDAHRQSGSPRPLVDWLAVLSAQASTPEPKARQTAARARRREIDATVARLVDAGSAALLDAHSAWEATA